MPITLGMLASSGVKTRLEYQTSASDSSAKSTYTFSGVAFGAAETNRLIVVLVAMTSGTISSVTIGGVSATLIQSNTETGSQNDLYAAVVSTGTSGDVVINGANTPSAAAIAIWSLYGVSSTKKSSGVKSTTTDYPALTLAAGDIAIFGDWDGSSVTYTNATKNFGYTLSGVEFTGASYRATSPETRTVSNTSGGTGYSVYAVWGI